MLESFLIFTAGLVAGILIRRTYMWFEFYRGRIYERNYPEVNCRVIHKQTAEEGTVVSINHFDKTMVKFDDRRYPVLTEVKYLKKLKEE